MHISDGITKNNTIVHVSLKKSYTKYLSRTLALDNIELLGKLKHIFL